MSELSAADRLREWLASSDECDIGPYVAALDELLAENERLRLDLRSEHARFMGRHDAAVDWQLRAEAAEARCARLEAALRRYENEAPDWMKGIAREALADA